MAGICFWMLMFPIDAIKSRVQVFKPNMSVMKYTLHIIQNEGDDPTRSYLDKHERTSLSH